MSEGWVCPKCGRVYSPMTPQCFHCGPKTEDSIQAKIKNEGVKYTQQMIAKNYYGYGR